MTTSTDSRPFYFRGQYSSLEAAFAAGARRPVAMSAAALSASYAAQAAAQAELERKRAARAAAELAAKQRTRDVRSGIRREAAQHAQLQASAAEGQREYEAWLRR